MAMIINPGSGDIKETGEGWTNTHAQAKRNAYDWFCKPMLEQGFTDITVTDAGTCDDGRWKFIFKHTVTKVEVELDIHGIDDLEAYQKEYIFAPRVYWNGSSSGSPELEQFAADGYQPVMTYRQGIIKPKEQQ